MNLSCNVILDLIPLVKDGVANEDSSAIVYEHIKNCEGCREEFKTSEVIGLEQTSVKDEKIIFAVKRSIFATQIIILAAGGILGIALTNSMGMFYNLIIMPVIGVISYTAYRREWYLIATAIFIFTYMWQTAAGLMRGGFHWVVLYYGLYYSMIYTALVAVGVVITVLLKFAFKKER